LIGIFQYESAGKQPSDLMTAVTSLNASAVIALFFFIGICFSLFVFRSRLQSENVFAEQLILRFRVAGNCRENIPLGGLVASLSCDFRVKNFE
jgi:hypothetical protein